MAAIPTLEEEEAKRPHRERENLVNERTRIINRMKACLVRLGVRSFNPALRKAEERLEALRTPEGEALPPHTLAEMRRDLARFRFVTEQIKAIERARLERLEQASNRGPHAIALLLAKVLGLGVEAAVALVREILSCNLRDVNQSISRFSIGRRI